MDSNRDDAVRCMDLASTALAAGDVEKATRLVEKSKRMYPLPEIQNVLAEKIARARKASSKSEPSKGPSTASKSASSTSSSAKSGHSSRPSSSASPPPPRPATPEMEAAVASVHRKRNGTHYEVLEVSQEADDSVLKKSYRKLALRLHPDRNFAKGADEAFKRVSQAFYVLSDPQRRSHYDSFGSDDPGQPQPRRTNRTSAHANPFADLGGAEFVHVDGAFSPDDLFYFMFSNDPHRRAQFVQPGMRRRAHRRTRDTHNDGRRRNNHANGTTEEIHPDATEDETLNGLEFWERIRPLTWLFILMLMLTWWSGDTDKPSFSLYRTNHHSVARVTSNGVSFFMQPGKTLSHSDEQRIWRSVDLTALEQFRARCEQEEVQEQVLKQQSRSWFNGADTRKRYEQQLRSHRKPSCQQYGHLLTSIRRSG